MRIRSIHIRRFRSLASAQLTRCGNLNVLIGKNNAGKSSVLSAIDLVHAHLGAGRVSGRWSVPRPNDEFTGRDTTKRVQIGLEYELSPDLNAQLRQSLQTEAPHLDRAIEQLKSYSTVSFVIAGARRENRPFLFVEQITAGTIRGEDDLTTDGIKLLSVSEQAAYELFNIGEEAAELASDLHALERAASNSGELGYLFEAKERVRYAFSERYFGGEVRPALTRQLQALANESANVDEFRTRIKERIAEVRESVEKIQTREVANPITAFAGDVRVQPEYAAMLMQALGSEPVLHLRETKAPIGREEADALLNLKVTRGGPERLASVQRTIRALLGVEVDAFQADTTRSGSRIAEMDVDQFLAEANGAGIREALRLILDLELKRPTLALIEEPEVHLHPGLEHAVYSYLRDKSADIQMFVTTHSTSFVDSVSFQNIYLLSRDQSRRTTCTALDEGDGALKIPAELGLRLSTVFMYDRLVFVEGPSDEAVLRELARTVGADMPKGNVGFVKMGGVANFAHYAAEGTIDLLARRNVRMWFITDRDERSDEEVSQMLERLGERAKLVVLKRRELENYLLHPAAVLALINDKRAGAHAAGSAPAETEVASALAAAAEDLKATVEDLRASRAVLGPVYLQRRGLQGSREERIRAAIDVLQERLRVLGDSEQQVAKQLSAEWSGRALELAPGAMILDEACRQFGVRFNKEAGDSARLARLLPANAVPEELRCLLSEMAS